MKNQNFKLDKEEQYILDAFEGGELKTVSNFEEERKIAIKTANNTLKKLKKNIKISLRINEYDLNLIKNKAHNEGLPYQTLIGSILHKYASKFDINSNQK